MMTWTAGGPGLTPSSITLAHQKRPRTLNLVIFSTVVMAHVALGTRVYHQSFGSGATVAHPSEPPAVLVSLERPRIAPPLTSPPEAYQSSPRLNRPILSPVPVADPLVVDIPESSTPTSGLVLDFNEAPPEALGTAPVPIPSSALALITRPDWISRPSAAQMSRAFPQHALNDEIGGAVKLQCQVLTGGNLANCSVTDETPVDMGFGHAAMRLTRHFKLSPRTVNGQAVDGAAVVFTVRFGVAP